MGADDLMRLRVTGGRDHERLAWADGTDVTLPERVLDALGVTRDARQRGELVLSRHVAAIAEDEAARLRLSHAFTDRPPASARLPVSYHMVPGVLRGLIASAIGRWNRARIDRWARFPAWPLDLSADFLADLAGVERGRSHEGPAPVMLSHDIDSPEGLENLVKAFLPLEEAVGARSTNFVVPCGYAIDHGLLGEVRARGHDVGVHGYDHANRTAFAGDAERRQRLDAARPLVERYAVSGYRAPSLLRTRQLLRDLASRYRYDSSIPTSGGLFPVPNSGCASARPFVVEGITEIPISLPRDGSLRFLGYSPREIADLWMACANRVAASGGVVMLLTHCERRFSGTPSMLDAYKRFLDFIASESRAFAWSSPADLMRPVIAK